MTRLQTKREQESAGKENKLVALWIRTEMVCTQDGLEPRHFEIRSKRQVKPILRTTLNANYW